MVKLGSICLLSLASSFHLLTLYGAENEQENEDGSLRTDLQFLEFFGQFETDEGEWIDPESLLAQDFDQLLDIAASDNPDSNDDQNSNDRPNRR